ncbi:MAG TPA: YHS domain-containing (seleno)protein [Devosiaceae bacterium]|nr:YHS domain-containing (seleno)protein [Devosiaceae bacterium]
MAAAVATIVALALPAGAASLVTDIVTDPLTGVAIEGYDPVTYFTDPDPQRGSPDHEYSWGGVPWYFVSAANRDVFVRAPDIYAPQFGGHCSMSLARGHLSDGNPRYYAIWKMKLHFFYSAANREAFLLSPEQAATDAAANWPQLSSTLSGAAAASSIGEEVEH